MNKEIAQQCRRDVIEMLAKAGSGHPGGSLSAIDILVALYEHMHIDPSNPKMEDRDRFVLSKGHAAPALYAILARKGFFEIDELGTLRKLNSSLQGHPDMKKTPGVDACTGSLGQGFSVAVGMALAAKYKKSDYKVYTLLGDGELQEGIIWEAAMSAGHYQLDNLVAIVDHNGLQIDGPVEKVMNVGNIGEKFKAFGFHVIEIDGHDFDDINKAIEHQEKGKPLCIVAKTTKGKGIPFMENQVGWHGKSISAKEAEEALCALEGRA